MTMRVPRSSFVSGADISARDITILRLARHYAEAVRLLSVMKRLRQESSPLKVKRFQID